MSIPRRFLPSMSLLTAFDAAARLESFTLAAEELSISQSAVSRQIRLLEEQIGTQLFVRERQTVRLSDAGAAYAREIGDALQTIGNASLNLRVNPQGGVLNLAILPTLGTRWLAPRLPRFLTQHPGITINLSTRLSAFDFQSDPLDAAIHFGDAPWAGTEGVKLMGEAVSPVCSPDFLAENPVSAPADLLGLPLIHLASRPDQWDEWFTNHGVETGPLRGMLFDQFATAAQAAASGLGVALLPTFLIDGDMQRGDLVPVFDTPMPGRQFYFLVWPKTRAGHGPLAKFKRWLVDETRESEETATD
jgi:LysR family glycine cleavage system transcriptional activator